MTNEQMRQRIVELEEALEKMLELSAIAATDPARVAGCMRIVGPTALNALGTDSRRAASLLSASPPASEPEPLHVAETCKENASSFAGEPDAGKLIKEPAELYGFSEPDADVVEWVARKIYWIPNSDIEDARKIARAAIAAICPTIDREKVEEIRGRHEAQDKMTEQLWTRFDLESHEDRAALLKMIGAQTDAQ